MGGRLRELAFIFCFAATVVQADCAERIPRAVATAEDIIGTLDARQRAELTRLFVDLCAERDAGASVAESAERDVYTTRGLKRDRVQSAEQPPLGVIVDMDGPRYRPRRREP